MSSTRINQEEDRIPMRPTLAIVAATLAIIALGIAWPWWMVSGGEDERLRLAAGEAPRTAAHPPGAFPGLRESLIEGKATAHPAVGAEENEERFAWVDRERGLVRIPLDDAMALWLARREGGR